MQTHQTSHKALIGAITPALTVLALAALAPYVPGVEAPPITEIEGAINAVVGSFATYILSFAGIYAAPQNRDKDGTTLRAIALPAAVLALLLAGCQTAERATNFCQVAAENHAAAAAAVHR